MGVLVGNRSALCLESDEPRFDGSAGACLSPVLLSGPQPSEALFRATLEYSGSIAVDCSGERRDTNGG